MNIDHLLIHRIAFKPKASVSNGDVVYGALVSDVPARVEQVVGTVSGPGGEQQVSTHEVMLRLAAAATLGGRVWLSGADTSDDKESYATLKVETGTTLAGDYTYYVLTLGK